MSFFDFSQFDNTLLNWRNEFEANNHGKFLLNRISGTIAFFAI